MRFVTTVSINDELCEVISNWIKYDNAKKHVDDMLRWLYANREYVQYNDKRVFCKAERRYHITEIDVQTELNEHIVYQIMGIKNEV